MLNGFQRTAAEVATAMNLSPRTPGFMVSHAETLATALPFWPKAEQIGAQSG